ncbi:MAG: hypothetical protein ABI333_11160 [bacterium]
MVLTWARTGVASEAAIPPSASTSKPVPTPREAELAPAVAHLFELRGLVVARELSVYPTRRSRKRTVADLVALRPDHDAIARRMGIEGRRVTVADFWPALLETLRLMPETDFQRRDLLELLPRSSLTKSMPAGRLSRYLRLLRRYGYLRKVGPRTYRKRSEYIPVAVPGSTVAVELKRTSYRAALAQARSYAQVVDCVYVATAGTWNGQGALAALYRSEGIGALEVHRGEARVVLEPRPGGRRRDPCAAYQDILAERLVREGVLGRPRAFG